MIPKRNKINRPVQKGYDLPCSVTIWIASLSKKGEGAVMHSSPVHTVGHALELGTSFEENVD